MPCAIIKMTCGDFPGGTGDKTLPANAGDIGSIPGPGRSMSQSSERRGVSKSSHRPNPYEFLFLSIKFYWNTAMPFHLHIVYGCFCPVRAEFTSCSRDCPAKSIYDLALYRNC